MLLDSEKNGHAGSVAQFDDNWKRCREARYNHWVRSRPSNQIQLAFRQHWKLFQEMMAGENAGRCLEVGCGRGSISSYFADHGFDCVLLDSSEAVLETARAIFERNGHRATLVHGDALDLPFEAESFDVVVSIGLLEHFEDVNRLLAEQVRVLRPGGLFLGYVVPENANNVQRYFRWLNRALGRVAHGFRKCEQQAPKVPVYRSGYGSGRYRAALEGQPVRDVDAFGVYPLPMISHSPEFPFSLLPAPAEWILTRLYEAVLSVRKTMVRRNPWICREEFGQAFLLTFRKAQS